MFSKNFFAYSALYLPILSQYFISVSPEIIRNLWLYDVLMGNRKWAFG